MPTDPSFKMTIMDVFAIRGRGTVVTGHVEDGSIKVGDTVELHNPDWTKSITVSRVEMFGKSVDSAVIGDQVGLCLQDIGKGDVKRWDVLAGIQQKTEGIKEPEEEKDIESLIRQFSSPDQRKHAADCLVALGGSNVADHLVRLLDQSLTSQFSLDVVETLVRLGDASVGPLVKLVKAHRIIGSSIHDTRLYKMVGLALSKLGKPAVDPLLQMQKYDRDHRIQEFIARVFCHMGDPALTEPLLEILRRTKSSHIALALGNVGAEKGLTAITEAVKDLNWKTCTSDDYLNYANAFILIGEPALEPLSGLMNSSSRFVRKVAKNATKKIQKNVKKGINPRLPD
ncbi:EF-Tu/IF-2/RF-3 family GTPase [Acidobacteriota bacterium]